MPIVCLFRFIFLKILESKRFGEINEIKYAFVAYRETSKSGMINLDCVVTDYESAYRLSLTAPEERIDLAVASVMDRISDLLSITGRTAKPVEWFKDHCVPLKDGFADSEDMTVDCRMNNFGELGIIYESQYFYCLHRWIVSFGTDDGGI